MKNSVLLPKKESKKKKDHGALALMCLKQVNSFSSVGKSVIWCFWSVCVCVLEGPSFTLLFFHSFPFCYSLDLAFTCC